MKHPVEKSGTGPLRAAASRPLARIIPLLLLATATCARPAPRSVPAPGGISGSAELVLLGTTDVHAHLYPYDYYTGRPTDRGLALLAPLIDSVRAAHPGDAYLFDSGDLLEGTPLAFVYARLHPEQPSPVIRAMNLLRYDASGVGNHEYNYGLETLDRAVAESRFPFVSANVFRHGTDQHAYRPYVLIPHVVAPGDTILIGVTGNTPPGVALWDQAHVRGRLDFRDVVASLRPVVAEMKRRGADVVVVLSHGGLDGTSYDTLATGVPPENESLRVAREIPGVDVIFMGHTHRELADSVVNGVLLTQAKNWARSVSVVDLRLRRQAAGRWSVASKHATLLEADPSRVDSAFLDSLRWEHERTVAYVRSVIGRSTERMEAARARVEDTPILDFVNEVQREAAGADLSATAAFSTSAAIPKGPITVAAIAGLYTYDNTLRAVRITGAELRAYLEKSAEYYTGWPAPAGGSVTDPKVPGYNFDVVSGVDYTIDLSKPVGSRITELRWHGAPVRLDQTFTLALNNYRQTGGGGFTMLADAPVVYDRQEDIRDLLIAYVRRHGTIRPEDFFHRSWRVVPAQAAEAAAREQRPRETAQATSPSTVPATVRLRVLATSDLHGHLLPETPPWAHGRVVGGAAALAGYFEAEREGFGGPTLLVDAGDLMQGTPISNLTAGRAAIAFYDRAGYGAAAIGNHEYDWGTAVLRDRLRQADFPWLAANEFVAGTDTAPSWVKPTALLDVDGVKVGVIGLATEATPTTTRAENVRGLEFRSGAAAIDRWVPELRRAGARFVVVLAHSGAICRAHASCEGEVLDWARAAHARPDLLVAGHTHQVLGTGVNGIPIVEPGSYGQEYAVVDLSRDGAGAVHARVRGIPTTFDDRVAPDTAVAALVARYAAEIGPRVATVEARLAEPLRRTGGDYPLGRLIADAQRWAAGAQTAIMNDGGIRRDLDAGPLTWGTLYELQPFQNRLVRLTLTGARLRAAVEHAVGGRQPDANVSGLLAVYDPAAPPGRRVLTLTLESGEPVRDDALYTVAVTDFLADGGDGFDALSGPVSREDTGVVDLDALIHYLKGLPQPVEAPDAPRLRSAAPPAAAAPADRRGARQRS